MGSPQEVWDHPASHFVYGFLGDVNLFHGRSHEGEMLLGDTAQGVRLQSPEHAATQDAKAMAYVRPHDLDITRYAATKAHQGIAARLVRAVVVGPIARLELEPHSGSTSGAKDLLEAHLGAQEFKALGLKEGDDVVATPRKARVFVQEDPALAI